MKDIKFHVTFLFFLTIIIIILIPQFNENIKAETMDWKNIITDYERDNNIDCNPMTQFRYAIALANVGEIREAYDIFKEIRDDVEKDKLERLIEEDIEKMETQEENKNELLLLNYYAFLNVIKKDYRESIKYFEEIEKLDPKNIWTLNFKAASYNELERYEDSKKVLNKALSIKNNRYSHLLLGIAQYYTGNYFKALNEMRKSGDLFGEIISKDDYK